ncbi:Hypothetical_protein [Hexamita inflata]|uniref:Hypothetical_protein n=1 Tax=Hexamita inflata TaxID=28002 RepID=A0AA86NEZ9_9EUKA|nr:Hypothetical protein HINF_LOCUS5743 [Hexamita inflata]CAI9946883.1 Hypothetical protein HINF_LOCUS34528 [Hexamita inflata]CAI9967229.1 Hypothetical protein HINF_LOCUS54874 [Hexamita inflata]
MELTPGALPTPGTFTIRKNPQNMYIKTLSSQLVDVKTTKDVLSALLKEFKKAKNLVKNLQEISANFQVVTHMNYYTLNMLLKNFGESIEAMRQKYPDQIRNQMSDILHFYFVTKTTA